VVLQPISGLGRLTIEDSKLHTCRHTAYNRWDSSGRVISFSKRSMPAQHTIQGIYL